MSLFVGLLEPRRADVRIDLSRYQTLVPQQFLNAADVGAAVEQMGRETVPQGVCLLYTSPSPRDATLSRMPSSA